MSDTIRGDYFLLIISLLGGINEPEHIYTGQRNFLSFPFVNFYYKKIEANSSLYYPLFPHTQLFWSHSSGRVRLSHQGKCWQDPCRDEAILNWWNHLKARKKKRIEEIILSCFFTVSKWDNLVARDAYHTLISYLSKKKKKKKWSRLFWFAFMNLCMYLHFYYVLCVCHYLQKWFSL